MLEKLPDLFIVNAGSSSIKAALYSIQLTQRLKLKLTIEIKGLNSKEQRAKIEGEDEQKTLSASNHLNFETGFQWLIELLDKYAPSYSPSAIGHRIVHGGPRYTHPTLIDETLLRDLKGRPELAPLHNPFCLQTIELTRKRFPHLAQYAVFDTEFHAHLLPETTHYPLPFQLTQELDIKRYGFHGIAHEFLWNKVRQFDSTISKVITIHLGSGCSVCAIQDGKSLDTSMGFTPLEGLMMSTRAGDIDVGILEYIQDKRGLSLQELTHLLNTQCGLVGVSGLSADMQTLLQHLDHPQVKLAIDMFCYRVAKYIASYFPVLSGVNALAFSGGIGENSPLIRKKILDAFKWMGIEVDNSLNEDSHALKSGEIKIIGRSSSIKIFTIGMDENGWIAQKILLILSAKNGLKQDVRS